MHTRLYALVRHDDVAKFEFEDGLVREAASALLAHPSSISEIVVDTVTSSTFADQLLGDDGAPVSTGFDALLRITASEVSDTQPSDLDDRVSHVARVVGQWSVAVREIASRDDSWVGTSTPGIKLNLLLTRGPGIDLSSYDGWLRDEAQTTAEKLDGAGVASISPAESGGTEQFDTLIEFSFPNDASLTSAIDDRSLGGIIGSELLDAGELRALATSEHVLTPNENAWHMHQATSSAAGGE